MSRILDHFLRLTAMLVGFGAAVLTASLFLNLVFISVLGLTAEEIGFVASTSLVVSVPVLALFLGYYAFLPAIVVMAATEILGLRDWLWHALGGGAVSAAVLAYAWQRPGADPAFSDQGFFLIVVAAGLLAGIAYWLVAGRGAGGSIGACKPPPTSPGPSGS
ncbi:hypothetical protein [Mesorhizobium xinjiangense]|uniref:hypothetical protein n=1 Tax=Mesorhizobium xinjiangense TaxID=2678685 RepID=UPI0012EDC444|nr:hypothetical protein [Mesorhizobium xinjiangense]